MVYSENAMHRSSLFHHFARIARAARFCDAHGLETKEGLEILRAQTSGFSRRRFLAAASGTIAGARASNAPSVNVGIVGAGLAGLACGNELKRKGVTAGVYEASTRIGGRCWSLRGFFPGQIAERGGEFIDTGQKTMIGYAREFGLGLEDVNKRAGDVTYYFNGQHYAESVVVDEYRAFVPAMRADLRALSREITADNHTDADVAIDHVNLLDYLVSRGAGSVAKAAIGAAYMAEYGLEADEQSCLNFLLFIHADRRSKFTPFGVFSDERYHVRDGNDGIAQGLASRLGGQIHHGMRLVRVRRTAAGAIEFTFQQGATTVTRTHDVAVLAIPFTALRGVELDASLGLPQWKRDAIEKLGYGTNAKMMVGFDGRPWLEQGSSGASYSDLRNHQTTWETNRANASASRGVLTDYSSGDRGASLNPAAVQVEAARFLTDLDVVYRGAFAAASRNSGGQFVAHLEHWPSNPLTLGSYTCYRPGQFTSIAGNEGKPVGNLLFAGEHTNSFYEWQGFLEGAALSGIDAATAILKG